MYEATLQLPPPASFCGVLRCHYNCEQATASNNTVMLLQHLHDQRTSHTVRTALLSVHSDPHMGINTSTPC
jgi:hypothetical protein